MYLKVAVIAGARQEFFKKENSGHVIVSVREKTERNLANKRVLEIIRREYGPDSKPKIVNGHRNTHKIISIEKA